MTLLFLVCSFIHSFIPHMFNQCLVEPETVLGKEEEYRIIEEPRTETEGNTENFLEEVTCKPRIKNDSVCQRVLWGVCVLVSVCACMCVCVLRGIERCMRDGQVAGEVSVAGRGNSTCDRLSGRKGMTQLQR